MRSARCPFWSYGLTLLLSLPFWAACLRSARMIYDRLPDTAPRGCFVVTAAGRGHQRLVGPFLQMNRRGCIRRVNRQLATFWQFEDAWQAGAPRSHAAFRRVYNRIGSRIARRIVSPWTADVVFLALKPAEWTCRQLLARRN
jgi:hypothetical protein